MTLEEFKEASALKKDIENLNKILIALKRRTTSPIVSNSILNLSTSSKELLIDKIEMMIAVNEDLFSEI